MGNLTSPTGTRGGRGGWLEYSDINLVGFRGFFKGLMPVGLTADDLTVLSSTFTNRHPDYKVLPPMDLWPNMIPTLKLLREIQAITGVDFEIASAYRSFEINKESKGATGSKHLDFSALDVRPKANKSKVEAFMKHYWQVKGKAIRLGLGYYSLSRFHIDALCPSRKARQRWEWNESAKASEKRYKKHFPYPLPAYIEFLTADVIVGDPDASPEDLATEQFTTGDE